MEILINWLHERNITLENILYFIQGHFRYFLDKNHMLKDSICKQVNERKLKAKICDLNGKCVSCGCKTPELFYADKGCSKTDDPCYQPIEHTGIWNLLFKMVK